MTVLPSHPVKAGGTGSPPGNGARVGQVFLDVRRRQLFCLDAVARQMHRDGIPFTPTDLETHKLLNFAGRPVTSAELPLVVAWHEERSVEATFLLPKNKGPEQRVTWHAAPLHDEKKELLGVVATVRLEAPEANWQALAGLAHDLRTPLNAITLQLAVLEHLAADNAELARVLEGLKSSADRALRVGQDLLNWLRFPSQRGKGAEPAWFPLEPLLADLAREQELAARSKGLVLATDFQCCQGWEAYTDRMRLTRILSNLLVNAIRYTPRGRVEFSTSWGEEDGKRLLSIGVVDTGVGITAEEQESIFQPGERGRAGKEGDSSGSGLGLAVVDSLVEELGVELDVYSEHGRGSSFHLLLPASMLRPAAPSPPSGS